MAPYSIRLLSPTSTARSSHEVQRAARRVTTSNEDEGFANAVERFILP